MTKRKAYIVLLILIFLSIVEILLIEKIILLPGDLFHASLIVYILVVLLLAFVLKKFVDFEADNVKEEVKIVYKDAEVEKKEVKETGEEKAQKIAEEFIKDLDGFDNKEKFTEAVLLKFAKTFDIVQGVFFIWDKKTNVYSIANTYAYYTTDTDRTFKFGEGITGQVAKNKKFLLIDTIPDNYITIVSGLGEGTPDYLAFVPVIKDDKCIAVIELASFSKYPEPADVIFTKIAEKLSDYTAKFV